MDDIDELLIDPNQERGRALTLTYNYAFNRRTSLLLEWLRTNTKRKAVQRRIRGQQLYLGVSYNLGY